MRKSMPSAFFQRFGCFSMFYLFTDKPAWLAGLWFVVQLKKHELQTPQGGKL